MYMSAQRHAVFTPLGLFTATERTMEVGSQKGKQKQGPLASFSPRTVLCRLGPRRVCAGSSSGGQVGWGRGIGVGKTCTGGQ